MSIDQERPELKTKTPPILVIHGAILFSVVIYGVALWFALSTGSLAPMDPEIYAQYLPFGIIVMVLMFLFSFWLPRLVVSKLPHPGSSGSSFVSRTGPNGVYLRVILTDSLVEGGVVIGLVLGLLGGGMNIFLPSAIVGVALLIYFWPTQRAIERMMEGE